MGDTKTETRFLVVYLAATAVACMNEGKVRKPPFDTVMRVHTVVDADPDDALTGSRRK